VDETFAQLEAAFHDRFTLADQRQRATEQQTEQAKEAAAKEKHTQILERSRQVRKAYNDKVQVCFFC
jgi:hypothetical protein